MTAKRRTLSTGPSRASKKVQKRPRKSLDLAAPPRNAVRRGVTKRLNKRDYLDIPPVLHPHPEAVVGSRGHCEIVCVCVGRVARVEEVASR